MSQGISSADFVRLSLELNLFFLRIMKEHSLFLGAGFLSKDSNLARQADQFKNQFNTLLRLAVRLAHRNVSQVVLSSGEVVTDKTLRAEQKTIELSGTSIDTELTLEELRLGPGVPNPVLENELFQLNEQAIALTQQLIAFKTQVLDAMLTCKLFTSNFPLLIDHIRREAIFFVEHLQRLQRRQPVDPTKQLIEEKAFWDRIMKEHAQFIAHLLDPTEVALIDKADKFADLFKLLETKVKSLQACAVCSSSNLVPVREETTATQSIRNFKATATDLILACRVKSLIIPLLGDHVLREANHFLRILTHVGSF